MSHSRRFAAAGTVLSALLAFGSLALADDHRPLSKNEFPGAMPLEDPGTPPPLILSDYAPYLGVGRSTVYGYAYMLRADRKTAVGCDRMYLAPDTPFTEWMLAKWVRALNGHEYTFSESFPSQDSAGIPIPKVLNAGNRESTIRFDSCRKNGGFRFDNLPIGRYLLFGFVQDIFRGETFDKHFEYEDAPDGSVLMYDVETPIPYTVAKLGYVVSAPGIVVQHDGYYSVTSYNVNARFWGSGNENSPP